MRDPEASDFCYYPFFQVLVTAEGKYRPCSKHVDHITHEGKVLTTADATLEEAWNSDYMTTMREYFHSNKQFPGCAECWRLQKIGLRSMRYDSYQYDVPESQVENPEKPLRIELNSSNVCNLKCRICYATASTQWITEAKNLYGFDENLHINLSTENLEQVKAWAENIHELCLFGGEPLILPGNIDLLNYLIEKGFASSISLLFNTNGTIFNSEISEMLKQFKRVRISFSIDDIGKRFEYQRTGADWNEVEANLKDAYDLFKTTGYEHIEMKICCTVSLFNAYYLPEMFEYFGREFPGLKIFFNYLFNPTRMNIQILPEDEKKIVLDRIRHIKPNFDLRGEDGKLIENILTYIEYREKRPISEFIRIINRHDVYRKESYPDVFPEFWDLIKKYKPEQLTMGVNEVDVRPDSDYFQWKYKNRIKDLGVRAQKAAVTVDMNDLKLLAVYEIFEEEKHKFDDVFGRMGLFNSYIFFLKDRESIRFSNEGFRVYLQMIDLYTRFYNNGADSDYLHSHISMLLNGPCKKIKGWTGADRVIDIDRPTLIDMLNSNKGLPVDAERLVPKVNTDQVLEVKELTRFISEIKKRFRRQTSLNGCPSEAQFVTFSLFEVVKNFLDKNLHPRVFAAYYKMVAGPGDDIPETVNEIGGLYLRSLADTIDLIPTHKTLNSIGKAKENLQWVMELARENSNLPDEMFINLMLAPRDDLLEVLGNQDTAQLRANILEAYSVTV